MSESYEGITVPEGEPEGVLDAAAQLNGVAGLVDGAATSLGALPGGLVTWQGPASSAFASTASSQAAAAQFTAGQLDAGVQALRDYAGTLRTAKRDARDAIERARDANRRIKAARAAIDAADTAAAGARTRAVTAQTALDASAGVLPGALNDLYAAQNDEVAAEADGRAARRRLQEAEEDLRRAQRDGQLAEESARIAARGVTAALDGTFAPAYGLPGGAATAATGGSGGVDLNALRLGFQFVTTGAAMYGRYKWMARGGPAAWRAFQSWSAVGGAEPGMLGSIAKADAYARLPTFQNGLLGKGLTRALGSTGAADWLSTAAKAGPALRGLGAAGGAVSTVLDTKNLIEQGNPVDAFQRDGAGYVADVARTGFSASSTAFMVAPNPVTGGAVIVTGAVWAGAEIYQNRAAIGNAIASGADFAWDNSVPGQLWNRRDDIGRAVDSGVDWAKGAAADVKDTVDAGLDKARDIGSGVADTVDGIVPDVDLTPW